MAMAKNEIIEIAKKEIACIVMNLVVIEENKASQISNDIVRAIDWNNSALMHKGLSWMTKNYLVKRNML